MKRFICKSYVSDLIHESFDTFEEARRYAYMFDLMIIDTTTGERVY